MSDFRVVAADLAFPEGPVAMADGSLLVAEIAGQTIKRVDPAGTVSMLAAVGGGPNGLDLVELSRTDRSDKS